MEYQEALKQALNFSPISFTDTFVKFVEIKTRWLPGYKNPYSEPVLDWWPRDEFEGRRHQLAHNKMPVFNWEAPPKGVLRTAKLVWNHQESVADTLNILIVASLWNMSNHFPAAWRGPTHTLVEETFSDALVERQDFWRGNLWHHQTDSLPYTIIGDQFGSKIIKPTGKAELLHVVFLELAVILGHWILIKYSQSDG
jgi:hypothetical protein